LRSLILCEFWIQISSQTEVDGKPLHIATREMISPGAAALASRLFLDRDPSVIGDAASTTLYRTEMEHFSWNSS